MPRPVYEVYCEPHGDDFEAEDRKSEERRGRKPGRGSVFRLHVSRRLTRLASRPYAALAAAPAREERGPQSPRKYEKRRGAKNVEALLPVTRIRQLTEEGGRTGTFLNQRDD